MVSTMLLAVTATLFAVLSLVNAADTGKEILGDVLQQVQDLMENPCNTNKQYTVTCRSSTLGPLVDKLSCGSIHQTTFGHIATNAAYRVVDRIKKKRQPQEAQWKAATVFIGQKVLAPALCPQEVQTPLTTASQASVEATSESLGDWNGIKTKVNSHVAQEANKKLGLNQPAKLLTDKADPGDKVTIASFINALEHLDKLKAFADLELPKGIANDLKDVALQNAQKIAETSVDKYQNGKSSIAF